MLYDEYNRRALAGTRFLGILKMNDTAYIPYYVENNTDGITVNYEKEMYRRIVRELTDIYHIKILLVGETLEELVRNVYNCDKTAVYTKGKIGFKCFLEECGCDTVWVSVNKEGVMQMRIMKNWRYKDKLLRLMNLEGTQPTHFKACDGIDGDKPFVIVLDLDIRSKKGALQQIAYTNNESTIPYIYCLCFQVEAIQYLFRQNRYPKCMLVKLDEKCVSDKLDDNTNYLKRMPFMQHNEFMELKEINPYKLKLEKN